MADNRTHTAELSRLAADVPALIDELESQIASVKRYMDELTEAGLIYANEHWRKDRDGQPKYFYLLYPQQPGEPRRRDYIGKNTARIEAAKAGIRRAQEYDSLAAEFAGLCHRVRYVADALREARRYLSGK